MSSGLREVKIFLFLCDGGFVRESSAAVVFMESGLGQCSDFVVSYLAAIVLFELPEFH